MRPANAFDLRMTENDKGFRKERIGFEPRFCKRSCFEINVNWTVSPKHKKARLLSEAGFLLNH